MVELGSVGKAQIALEFLIVYSFVLIIFILLFSIISTQRAATLSQQQYSVLQLQVQNIASYIDQAVSAGNGYSTTTPLISGLASHAYNLSISSTGVVIAGTKVGTQPVIAYAFSNARSTIVNGTLQQTANGISIYQIQTSRGSITISNVKGTIYIDQQPTSTSSLAQGAVMTQMANVKVGNFNGNTYGVIPDAPSIDITNSITISAWIYIPPNTFNINAVGANSGGVILSKPYTSYSPPFVDYILTMNYGNGCLIPGFGVGHSDGSGDSTGFGVCAPPSSYYGQWVYVAATYNSTKLVYYRDGVVNYSAASSGKAIESTSTPLSIGEDLNGVGLKWVGNISNIQLYNTALTANQILAQYQKGIAGGPINQNLAGWWPLNGNMNDYGGYNNNAAPKGTSYHSVVQLNAKVFSTGNTVAANSIVGFIASTGILSGYGNYSSSQSTNGFASAFIATKNVVGSGNVTADLFNGNLTTVGNLIGWWPLDTGYGNVIYDISGRNDNGVYNTPIWKLSANQTNFVAATFPGDPTGVSNSNTQDGFIKINSSQSLLGIVSNNTFTVAAWIYYKGPNSHSQGIFGDMATATGGGFQLVGYCSSCANNAILYVNGSALSFPNTLVSFPPNTWEMVTAEYNGNTGAAKVYLNNNVFASGTLPKNLGLLQIMPYYIGNDAFQPGGLDTFNGSITNVQLYENYLSTQQISSLYFTGIGAPPVGNGGLVGWWPLLNSTRDYSSNNNTGNTTYNVSFVNSAYNNTVQASGPLYASFNGVTNAIIPYSNTLAASGHFSVSLWFLSYQPPTSAFDSELVDARQPAADYTYDLQICGAGGACSASGLSGSGILTHVGTGAAWLVNGTAYQFSFTPYTWYNVVETINTTKWALYLNGNKVLSGLYSGTPLLLNTNNYIKIAGGQEATAGMTDFNGQIADLQVYNSVLTSQQAAQLYLQGLPQQYKMNISTD